MDEVKKFYSTFNNGHVLYDCNREMVLTINDETVCKVLDFGCGTGKVLNMVDADERVGIDVSLIAVSEGYRVYEELQLIIGDEATLANYKDRYFDISYTISVLNHLPELGVFKVVNELKRVSKKIFIMESQDVWQTYCYPHDYEKMGFKKLDYTWISPASKALYEMYVLVS